MRIITWNVKGLRSPGKHSMVLRHLKRLGAVALLQVTHLEAQDFPWLKYYWVAEVIGSPAQTNKAGVITLLHKNLNCEVIHHHHDEER